MWRFLVALLLLCASAQAQDYPIIGGGVLAPAATYSGPGNVVSGATAWYGLRAYNAAYAVAGSNAINVRRASDNSTENIAVLSTGALNISAANTFAGTDATASCTFATTTATCTGASSTPHVGSTITGSGVTEPCYVTAVGTFTGGSGTLTVSGNNGLSAPCGTIASATSITLQYGLYVTEAYDQSGSNACSSAPCNASQGTAADQPQLFPTCINLLPCLSGSGSRLLISSAFTAIATPQSLSAVYNMSSTAGSFSEVIASQSNAGVGSAIQKDSSTANSICVSNNGTSTCNTSVPDGSWHAVQGIVGTGSSGILSVDGSSSSGSVGTTSTQTTVVLFASTSSTHLMTGNIAEAGIWPSAFSSTVYGSGAGSLCHNQYSYWATSVSC